MDLSRAYQEVKSLPDEVLARELEQPSGMVPGYLVMAELEDRKALRSSASSQAPKTSMKDELLQGIGSIPQGYAGGGLVYQTNPFYYNAMARSNPEVAASMMQEQMMKANGGYFPLNPPSGLQQPGAPAPAGAPTAPNSPMAPMERYAQGGQVRRPEEDMGRFPSGMPVPGTPVRVGSSVRTMPEMNSELMRRDLQGWGMLQGNVDWEYLNPPVAPKADPSMPNNGGITPGPMIPERPKREALAEFLTGIGSVRR